MKKLFYSLFLLAPMLASAQQSDLGNWIIYLGDKKLKGGFNWHHEVQHRNYNAIGDLEQLLLRTGLGYNLSGQNNNVLLGYAYILSQNYLSGTDEKTSIHEHRLYQQFITRQRFSRFYTQHRYRFEQRWVEGDFKLRLRYFLSLNVPLNHKTLRDNTLYLSAYNEIFLNVSEDTFDRNRLYFGLGYKPSSLVRFELGYLNQFLKGIDRDQINLIAFLNF